MRTKLCIIMLALVMALPGGPLSAQEQSITIKSTPQGADVYWQGKKLGTTPLLLTPRNADAAGFFKPENRALDFYLYKDFYETEVVPIPAGGVSPAPVSVTLRPLPCLPYYDGVFKNDRTLEVSNVIKESPDELAFRREEIFARYGRPIQDARFKARFNGTRWYRENPLYDDSMLTANDRKNIKLINDFLEVNETDKALFSAITRQYEFRSADKTSYIRFINAKTCAVGFSDDSEHQNTVPYFFYASGNEYPFVVAGGVVYVYTDGFICSVHLDLKKKQLTDIELLQDMNRAGSFGF